MRKTTRSILQELNDISMSRNVESIIESRSSNIIQSAINLLDLIKETYDPETALSLERRFLSSIRSADIEKFTRNLRRAQDKNKDIPI